MDAGHEEGTGDAAEGPPVAHVVDNTSYLQQSEGQRPGKETTQLPMLEKQSSTSHLKVCAAPMNEPSVQKGGHHAPITANTPEGVQTDLPPTGAESALKPSKGGLPSISTVFSRISDTLTGSRGQAAGIGRAKAMNPLDSPPRRLSGVVQHDPLPGGRHDTNVDSRTGPGAPPPNGPEAACHYTSTLTNWPRDAV